MQFGSPKGNRTPDSAVRGQCLDRLTMGPFLWTGIVYYILYCFASIFSINRYKGIF